MLTEDVKKKKKVDLLNIQALKFEPNCFGLEGQDYIGRTVKIKLIRFYYFFS